MRAVRLVLVALLACSGTGCDPEESIVDGALDDGGPADAGLPDSAADDGGGDAGPAPRLAGTLVDEAGDPIGAQLVLACMATVCFYADTDGSGRFAFDVEGLGGVALKTPEDRTTTPRRAATLCPVQLVDETSIDVGRVFVPELPEGAVLGPATMDPQTLEVGDGAVLTLRRADLTGRLGAAVVDIAARAIPEARRPALDLPDVVAVYALYPTATVSSSPISVRIPSDVPAGTRVSFRTISEIDGAFSAPIPGEADGAFVETDPASGITELTWLVVSRE